MVAKLVQRVFTQSSQSTTIGAGSNGSSLPQSTIYVFSTANFPSSGQILVTTSAGGLQTVTYTGLSGGNQFTGCTGGTGTMSTGGAVSNAFLVPAGVNFVRLSGYGGGGGGGGGQGGGASTDVMSNGGGGGAGAVMQTLTVSVTSNTTYAVTVGGGGVGGSSGPPGPNPGTPGGNGSDTLFGSLATFKGGCGGNAGDDLGSGGGLLLPNTHRQVQFGVSGSFFVTFAGDQFPQSGGNGGYQIFGTTFGSDNEIQALDGNGSFGGSSGGSGGVQGTSDGSTLGGGGGGGGGAGPLMSSNGANGGTGGTGNASGTGGNGVNGSSASGNIGAGGGGGGSGGAGSGGGGNGGNGGNGGSGKLIIEFYE